MSSESELLALLERERAARVAAESELNHLRTALAQAPGALAITMGPEHRYVLSNETNQQYSGGRALPGRTAREAMPELEGQGYYALLNQVYFTGEPFVGMEIPIDLAGTPTQPARKVYLNGTYQPLRGSDGTIQGVLAFAYDVTDLVLLRQRAEQSEERFRMALGAAELGTWDHEPHNETLTCDDRFRELHGVAPDAVVTSELLMDAIHPDDRARVADAVRRSFDPRGSGEYAIEYRTRGLGTKRFASGTDRWLAVRGRTFFDPHQKPARFTGVAHDVTEQARASDALRRAEERSRTVADALPEIVWTADASGAADFYNRRWYELTGLPAGSIDPEGWRRAVHPDDLPAVLKRSAASIPAGESFEMELRLLRASDHSYRWHVAKSVPIRDEDGSVVRWVGSSVDIDDRKRVEEITKFLGDATALLNASFDLEHTLRSLARLAVPRLADWCAITLVKSDDLTDYKKFVAHVDPKKVALAEELNRRYPPDVNASRGEFEVIRTGQPLFYGELPDEFLEARARDPAQLAILRTLGLRSMMTVPISTGDKRFGAISFISAESGRRYKDSDLVLVQALAERAARAVDNARLYSEAQDAIRVRDDFLSIASHELRTPLTPLQLHVQSLQQPDVPPEKVARKLEVIGRQVDRLERLVGSLLDISRITSGRFDMESEELDLADLAREVVTRFQPEAARANSPLLLDAPSMTLGSWDRLRLDQVLSNLVGNAVKFGAGHPIEVILTEDSQSATLVVRDQGIGIGPEDQKRIFDRFERAVANRHFGGFGLGLWIVRQIVEAMGGTIGVESAPGQGSTFTLRLPRARELVHPAASSQIPERRV